MKTGMRRLVSITVILFAFGCSNSNQSNKDFEEKVVWKTIRYTSKIPPRSNHQTKFKSEFDEYYRMAQEETSLINHFQKEDTIYCLLFRVARSMSPMKEAIGVKLIFDKNDSLAYYNEVFRTWKMNQDTLKPRADLLFNRMVQGKDLSLYFTKYQGDGYIEFPDERFSFDPSTRLWKDSQKIDMN